MLTLIVDGIVIVVLIIGLIYVAIDDSRKRHAALHPKCTAKR